VPSEELIIRSAKRVCVTEVSQDLWLLYSTVSVTSLYVSWYRKCDAPAAVTVTQ